MPLQTIQDLARDLTDALTRERDFDMATGFELGKLAAQIALLTGISTSPLPRTSTTHTPAAVHQPVNGAGASGPPRDRSGQFVSTGSKRQRPEKRPMRKPQRIVTGRDGHVVVFDFERLQIKDSPPDGDPHTFSVADRKEMWKRYNMARDFFKRQPVPA